MTKNCLGKNRENVAILPIFREILTEDFFFIFLFFYGIILTDLFHNFLTKNNNPHFHDISAIFEGNIWTDDLFVFSKQKNKNIKKIRQIVTERREKGFCLN